MIINICGTNGSGKSYLARRLLEVVPHTPEYREGKSRPYAYELQIPKISSGLRLIGHYEIVTGGADTIKVTPPLFDELEELQRAGRSVLYEGSYVMGATRGPILARLGEMHVIWLDVTLSECITSVEQRRKQTGKNYSAPVNVATLRSNESRSRNYAQRMREAGASVYKLSREDAKLKLGELLELQL